MTHCWPEWSSLGHCCSCACVVVCTAADAHLWSKEHEGKNQEAQRVLQLQTEDVPCVHGRIGTRFFYQHVVVHVQHFLQYRMSCSEHRCSQSTCILNTRILVFWLIQIDAHTRNLWRHDYHRSTHQFVLATPLDRRRKSHEIHCVVLRRLAPHELEVN